MIKTNELRNHLNSYMKDKTTTKELTEITVKKQVFNITKFIEYLEANNIETLDESNVLKELKKYRDFCLYDKEHPNKRTSVKTYIMNIIDFLNYPEVKTSIGTSGIKVKDVIIVKAEDPETEKERIEKIALTWKQADYFLETIATANEDKAIKDRDIAICSTFLNTGCRLVELVNLNKTDIKNPRDENGFYIIPEDPNEIIDVHLRKETTKGKKKDRTVFITAETLKLINTMIKSRISKLRKNTNNIYRPIIQRKKAEEEKTRTELFITRTGNRIAKRTVQDMIKKYAKLTDERIIAEGIKCPFKFEEKVSVHILRHTALSLLANDPVNAMSVPTVQAIAGHSSSQVTDKYIHPDHEIARSNYKKIMKNRSNSF
jgi:integrase